MTYFLNDQRVWLVLVIFTLGVMKGMRCFKEMIYLSNYFLKRQKK